jgi:probable HAF family extracellular repeat protein
MPSYRTIILGTLGGTSSVPTAVNDYGAVVGWANTATGALHPFMWWHGRMTDLGTLDDLDGGWGIAADINRHGTVVGQSDRGGVSRAVRWQHGRIRDLGTLGGPSSFATAINDHGVIVGASTTRDGVLHAFIWRDGRMTDLGVPGGGDAFAEDINNRDQVVGFATPTGMPNFPFRWQRGRVTILPASRYGGQARAINDAGTVVGSVSGADNNQAARWSHGRISLLETLPGGDAAMAWDVNERGVILAVGNVRPQSLDDHAFLWRRGVLLDLSTAGVPASVAALNDRNEIIGPVPAHGGDGAVAALFVPTRPSNT